jgi:hypothetical protein
MIWRPSPYSLHKGGVGGEKKMQAICVLFAAKLSNAARHIFYVTLSLLQPTIRPLPWGLADPVFVQKLTQSNRQSGQITAVKLSLVKKYLFPNISLTTRQQN